MRAQSEYMGQGRVLDESQGQRLAEMSRRLTPADRAKAARWLELEDARRRAVLELAELEYEVYCDIRDIAVPILESHGFSAELLNLRQVYPMLNPDEQETVSAYLTELASEEYK
jgi:hypothetical protein